MKKRIAMALAMILSLATLAGCGDNTANTNATDTEDTAVTEEVEIDPLEYVTPGDYSAITIEVEAKDEVTEEDIDAQIESILSSNAYYNLITDRVAAEGDLVQLEYIGTSEGEEFDSGTIGADGDDFELGSGVTIDGFEDAIVGMAVGENKLVDLTFPADYSATDLAGKDATFDLTLTSIKEKVIPTELTEEMITAAYENCTTVEELREAIRAELQASIDTAYNEYLQDEALNAVLASSTFAEELPESMVSEYADGLVSQTSQWASMYGVTLEDLVTSLYGETMDDFYAEVNDQAIVYTKRDLLMQALVLQEGIEATAEDVQAFAAEHCSDYGYESGEAFIEAYGEDVFYPVVESLKMYEILQANSTVTILADDTTTESN